MVKVADLLRLNEREEAVEEAVDSIRDMLQERKMTILECISILGQLMTDMLSEVPEQHRPKIMEGWLTALSTATRLTDAVEDDDG